MKRLILTFLTLTAILPCLANDGVFYASGNTLIPVRETVVRMDKEILTLRRSGEQVLVNVYFEFFNPGPEKEETVGFVTPPAGGDIPEDLTQHPQIKDFTVRVNGESLPFKIFRAEGSGLQLGEDVALGDDFVYHFQVKFKPGLNKVEHTYSFKASQGIELDYGIDYRLTTGTLWAGGKIGDFSLNIEMEAGDYFALPWSFQGNGSPADWKLEGTGRLATQPKEAYDLRLRMARLMSGRISLHATNFKPERDLSVQVLPLIFSTQLWSDSPDVHPFQDKLFLYIPPMPRPEEGFTPLSDNELRYLRNFFYAWEGYAFKSADLDSFFRQFTWYIPDPKKTMEQIQLNAETKKLIADIQAEEKRRK